MKNLMSLMLKNKIGFFAKHLISIESNDYNTPYFWDQLGSTKFSFNNGIWKSENKDDGTDGGICQIFENFKSISFMYKTSTYRFDYLDLKINRGEQFRAGGEHDWKYYKYEPEHIIENCFVEILYRRHSGKPEGSNTVWLKDLKIDAIPKLNPLILGWSLLHQFSSSDNRPLYPNIRTIKGELESINSRDKLKAAGISYLIDDINSYDCPLEECYMKGSCRDDRHAYIEVPLPDGYNTVMVEYGNWCEFDDGKVYLYIGDKKVQTIGSNHGSAIYTGPYHHGDTLKIVENGSFWVKAIWVKKQ